MAGSRLIGPDNFGAWVLKCNPEVWDLPWYLGLGLKVIDGWSLGSSYRVGLMKRGQPVVFWVSGAERGPVVFRGVWGFGRLTSGAYESPGLTAKEAANGGWLDVRRGREPGYVVDTRIPLLANPIPAAALRADPILADSEIFRAQQMSNPVFLTKDEFQALKKLRASWPSIGNDDGATAVVSSRGAGFGTAEQNRKVEHAAMATVRLHYERQGYEVKDVSRERLGWDLTALPPNQRRRPRFIEVKGVSGSSPKVLLTRNEIAAAERESDWELAVVTCALTKPSVSIHSRKHVIRSVRTFVWEADLS